MGGFSGSAGAAQNSQGIAIVQVVERFQSCRVVLPQRATQGVGVPGAGPDQVLVCSGDRSANTLASPASRSHYSGVAVSCEIPATTRRSPLRRFEKNASQSFLSDVGPCDP
jgi:hypothetical protein